MSSNINPSNINGSYPIAGQDNDSQGFRDNFTNIRTNLTYAQKEIEDLQNKAVLKAPLAGSTTTTVSNNLTGVGLTGATVAEFVEYANFDDTPVLNDLPLEFSKGHLHKYIAGGNIRLDLGWGAVVSGTYAKMRLWINFPDTTYTLTFPGAVSVGLGRILGVSGQVFTPPAVGDYLFEFSTLDAGSTVVVSPVSVPVATIEQGHDVVENGNSASISTATTSFATAVASTASLSTGREGQVKTLIANGLSANMVFTVANPGWGGTGQITFSVSGAACTLQYIAGKWFCIGNNGAVFS